MKKYKAEKIGHVIAAKRKELGMTQESLASLLQITPQAISKWENETGFPDLTLIPHIAEALQISPNELFGDDKRTTGKCPEHFQGLPFICANGNVALYSNKTVENEQGSIISFTDGSTADLENETVINKGAGEARILQIKDIAVYVMEDDNESEYDSVIRSFENIHSISLVNSFPCDITIEKGENRTTTLEAKGDKRFISNLKLSESDSTLSARTENNNSRSNCKNTIKIKCGFSEGRNLHISIMGSGSAIIAPSFENAELSVMGSGNINTADTKNCSISIMGSGDVTAASAKESLSANIMGSGDISSKTAKNVTVNISGSGDFNIKSISGFLDASISGSGDFFAEHGEVDLLSLTVSGSGDFEASAVTVHNAKISLSGPSSATIGHIIGKSEEKLSSTSSLNVLKRG